MRRKKVYKSIFAVALTLVILSTTIGSVKYFSVNVVASSDDVMDGQVIDNPWVNLFTTAEEPTTKVETTTEEPITYAPGYYDVSVYKSGDTYTYPAKDGHVFAGWYTDDTCETVYEGTFGTAYAKFIDENVLTAKFQLANDKTAIRFLSTIDSIDYQEVGFIFDGRYGSGTISEKTKHVASLFTSLVAENQKVYPSAFCDTSIYFFTYTIRKLDPGTDSTWNVTPYFVTPDGTKVTGIQKTHSINNS